VTTARIFRPSRGATSSGKGRTKAWVLQYERAAPRSIEPLMGWTSSSDMNAQVNLSFDTREEAIAYAEKRGLQYRVDEPPPAAERRGLSYSDNFKTNRQGPWTH
jgi:hypothetical protein